MNHAGEFGVDAKRVAIGGLNIYTNIYICYISPLAGVRVCLDLVDNCHKAYFCTAQGGAATAFPEDIVQLEYTE